MTQEALWIEGVVVAGAGRGRKIGFPTANVQLAAATQRPEPGVYAVWVQLPPDTRQLPAALHVGPRPTFNDAEETVEIHLIDFPDQSLYGKEIQFQLVSRLRAIESFPSAEALTEAIKQDCERALAILQP